MEEEIYKGLYEDNDSNDLYTIKNRVKRRNNNHKEYKIYYIIIIFSIGILLFAGAMIYISNMNMEKEKANAERVKKEAELLQKKEEEEKKKQNEQTQTENNTNPDTGQASLTPNLKKVPKAIQDPQSKIVDIYAKKEKVAYITFDDGPSSNITPKVLDMLKEEGVLATFFVMGMNVKAHPEYLKRAYDEGHYIANHSYTHKYSKIYASVDALLEEYNDTEAEIKKVIRK